LKKLLGILILALCCAHLQAQNVEGQIVASQYGTWQVPLTTPNSYAFSPTSCRVQGGSSFFFAFTVGTPIRIVDGNPALNEVVTPTAVVDTNDTCAISVAPVNAHQSPSYLQSATGGLQEALTQSLTTPTTNTVILNSAWYQSVGTSNAAAVIAAAKGSSQLGLVDVTTVPTSYYAWSGTQYVQVSSGGGATSPATNNVLKGTGGPNGIIPAIPGSDYVIPSGSIGGTAAGTVPGTSLVLKGSGSTGVAVPAIPGTDYVIPSGNVATATALQAAGTPCIVGYSPIGVDVHGNSLNCQPVGGGGGGGSNLPGAAFQLGGYQTSGTTIGPVNNVYSLTPATSLVQANALFAALPAATSTVLIPAGTPYLPYSNPNNVPVHSFRLGDDYLQIVQSGVACDAQQTPFTVTLTAGSNLVSVGALIGAASDVGKTMTFGVKTGYGYQAAQYTWTPTILSYTYPNFTLSSNAPFAFSGFAEIGTNNSAPNASNPGGVSNIQNALNNASSSFPLSIPSGCMMLVTQPLQWNNAQSIVGKNMRSSGFVGAGPIDILQQPDTSGGGTATATGVRLENIGFVVDASIDPTLGYTSYSAAGTPTVVPPIYRPLYDHTVLANNPLAPGWIVGPATNGVASTTQNSAVICTPNAMTPPVVGQPIMFPYFTTIFTSTVSSTAGSCSTGFTARTMAAALPNISGYTAPQAEWFTGTSIQSTTTAIPATPTYPFTITLTNSTAPVPGFESNIAAHGHIKACGVEFDYMGVSQFSPYTLTIRRGPASTPGCTGTTPIAPLNPCPAKNLFGSTSDQPWPVIPSINTGDSTPSGANWFPGECGGAAAISFPTANANVYNSTGLANGFLENLEFDTTGAQNVNGSQAMYFAANTNPYGTDIGGIKVNYLEFGIQQGPASAGQHGIGPVGPPPKAGPTGTGNTLHNITIRAAFPLNFVDFQQSKIDRVDTYSLEISPYDGTVVGPGTCLVQGLTLDEQNGAAITITAQNKTTAWNCENDGTDGSHAETLPYAESDGFNLVYDADNFEAPPSYFGGSQQTVTNSQLSLTSFNYGNNNVFDSISNSNAGYYSNAWDGRPQFLNWGTNSKCSLFAGNQGPSTACGTGFVQPASGHSIEASATGNTAHPYENSLGGMITPGEWNNNGAFDSQPMSVAYTVDPTELYWGSYAACNLGGAAQCQPFHFDGLNGFVYVGPHQRLSDGPNVLTFDMKSVAAGSTVTVQVVVQDSGTGQCTSPAFPLASTTINTTTSWQSYSMPVDFTGKAGCVMAPHFYAATTTDQFRVGYFNFVPVPQWQILAVSTPTLGASCPVNGTMLGSDANNLYMCSAGIVKGLPFGSGGLTNPMTTLGDTIYGGTSGTPTRLAGNTSTTPAIAVQTGTGSASAAPIVTAATGTGAPVLANTPQLVTPFIDNATGSSLTLAGPATGIAGLGTATYALGATAQIGTGATNAVCGTGFNCDSLSGTFFFVTGTGSLTPGTVLTITLPGVRTYIPTCPVTMKGGTTFLGPFAVPVNTSGVVTIPITTEVALAPSTIYTGTYGICGGI
jgi:hypothetical protein